VPPFTSPRIYGPARKGRGFSITYLPLPLISGAAVRIAPVFSMETTYGIMYRDMLRRRLEDRRRTALTKLQFKEPDDISKEFHEGQLDAISRVHATWRLKVLRKLHWRIRCSKDPYNWGYVNILNMAIRTLEEEGTET